MIRAIIFDFDGVIVLSEHIFTKIFVNMLNTKFDLEVKEEEFYRFSGLRFEERLKQVCEKHGIKLASKRYLELADIARQEYIQNSKGSVKLNVGLKKFLDRLKEASFVLAIGTNGAKRVVTEMVDYLNIKEYFETIVAYEDVKLPKPEPDVYLRCADNLNIETDECLVFEDSPAGVAAAKKAGMRCIALTTTATREELQDADLVIDSFYDISLDMLDEL
jgi:HAD superfamily hydrolase (TIGR01509 family)